MMIFYKNKQQINFYIGFLFLLILLANTSAVRAELLKSAAEPDYPPLSMVDENGEAMGFSVDLLNAVAKTMEHDIRFEVSPWSEIKQELADNKIDVLPLVGRTPERESIFDFTIPYLTIHGTIVVRKGNKDIHNIEDLIGKRIGVMKGDVAEEFLIRKNLNDNLTSTKNFDIAL
ncbi:MAG: transporter substrate-binding domain-containing protein, partial [Gammaproteobacteria bacterium]|nr:transporter substrate-binding domain-containing protein [Gammaproteobacteria bacterium]